MSMTGESASSKRRRQQELSLESSSSSSSSSSDKCTSSGERQQGDEGNGGRRGTTVFRQWLDEGITRADGRIDHDLLQISIGDESIVVSLGDAVRLRSPLQDEDEEYHENERPDTTMIARLERMWEERASESSSSSSEQEGDESIALSKFKIRARWFLNVSSKRGTPPFSITSFSTCPSDIILPNPT
jgi:hypothetical protein